MRKTLINAIVHNDFTREIPSVFEIFSNRMVFTSYGGLIPGQSKEYFFSCSSMPGVVTTKFGISGFDTYFLRADAELKF